jgi:hypothetical protein
MEVPTKMIAWRLLTTVGIVTLVTVTSVSGQAPVPAPAPQPYGLDPYNPHDAGLLRDYGAALVVQTPLLELARLNPYDPNHAALLRQIGGAITCCPLWYSPGPTFGPLTPFPGSGIPTLLPAAFPNVPVPVIVVVTQAAAGAGTGAVAPASTATQPSPPSVVTAALPESNDGVWIRYEGRRWISSGRAVPLQASEFERAGEYAGFAVYRRAGVNEDVIYVPTRGDLIAPYRLAP